MFTYECIIDAFCGTRWVEETELGADAWGDTVKDMILTARSFVDCALCSEAEKVFNEKDWVDIMENDGMGRFEDGERVE